MSWSAVLEDKEQFKFRKISGNTFVAGVVYDSSGNSLSVNSNGQLNTYSEAGLAIAKGNVTGTSFIHKFGNAADFDIADSFVTVWDGANAAGINAMSYTYSTTANITQMFSSSTLDTQEIEIQGLDENWALTVQSKTLNGQTAVTLDTPLIRVFRLKNIGSTRTVGTVYVSIPTTITGGVPNTPADVRALFTAQHQQTLMAVYSIPAGSTGYMRRWYASSSGARKTSTHQMHIEARKFGGVFQTKHVSSITISGTSYVDHGYNEPEIFTEKTDIEVHVNTDEDAAGISAGFDIILVEN